jgi:hypothetical protein
MITKVEAELPTLLFGHNARVLADQHEVDLSVQRLDALVKTICEPASPTAGFIPGQGDPASTHFTRVDIGWNFHIPAPDVMHAMRDAKHESINRPSITYQGSSITFNGTRVRIVIYDKARKERARSLLLPVTRIETQLHGEKISELFQTPHLTALRLDDGYRVYRQVLLGFRLSSVIPAPSGGTLNHFLAYQQARHPEEDVVADYVRVRGKGPRFHRDLRTAVGRIVPAFAGFSWAALLPESGLPPLVEIDSSKREAEFQQYLRQMGLSTLLPPAPTRVPIYA